MIKFNLEKALNGEPVVLRNGLKAYIFKNIQGTGILNYKADQPLIGMIQDKAKVEKWSIDGKYTTSNYSNYDIAGMWQEPPIDPNTLPKPIRPNKDQPYYYISGGVIEYEEEFWNGNEFDELAVKNGNCFRTYEDALAWLNFMKSKVE